MVKLNKEVFAGLSNVELIEKCIDLSDELENVRYQNRNLQERLGDLEKRLRGTEVDASDIVDEIISDIKNNNIRDLSDRVSEEADTKCIYTSDNYDALRNSPYDINDLDSGLWEGSSDFDGMVTGIAYAIWEQAIWDGLNDRLKDEFGSNDYDSYLGTFVECADCGEMFSPELQDDAIGDYNGDHICEDCVANNDYRECENCGSMYKYDEYESTDLCTDCAENCSECGEALYADELSEGMCKNCQSL